MLTGPVGSGGQNLTEDVLWVQRRLAALGYYGASPTGVCDPETVDAIRRFQRPFLSHPDGRVDVSGPTWTRLSVGLSQTPQDDGEGRGAVRNPVASISNESITRWVTRDGKEVRFATREGLPQYASWTRPVIFPLPPGARNVPVIAPYRTPLVPGGFNRLTSDRVRFLDAIRAALSAAGLNWDARVMMPLWANESGWDRANYGNNVGNIKSQGSVYSPSYARLIETRQVAVTVRESVGVMVFADRVRSIDGYHAFSTAAHYARYCERIFSSYPGALRALQSGGLEGAQAFAHALQSRRGHHYSPASVEDAVAMFRGSYNRSAALIGPDRYVR
ncbi:MAG: peptidoglycan-binding protein [Bryobacterales bacterium]|nr:peptidoglycan-binding protein [Bryobacterales bacterium]